MELVAAELSSGRANDSVIDREKQIEDDLQELLNALKQASRPTSSQSGGQCSGCNGNLNKLLAEVKMLKFMELGLNKETRKVEAEFAGKPMKDPELAARLKSLTEQQQKIQMITQRLHDSTCEDCLGK